jgi:hypothetical protein
MVHFNLVDRRRYPNAFRAIFYDLTLMRTGNPFDTLIVLLFPIIGLFFSLNLDEPVGRFLGATASLLGLILPFFFSFINYFSVIELSDNEYRIRCFSFTYRKGEISDLIELHQLSLYQGCYRVRTSGLGVTSGFLLFYSRVPDFFERLEVVDMRENEDT